ncbi:MAG: FAD-dependent oxidoreductase [Myxococcota bacterium]|nr:FAD-dependent oxidoreductase [Myxococcota bacterium]
MPFDALLKPIRIGRMELANRIAMAPMTVDYGNDDETPSERQIAYYSERAKWKPGLISLEVCSVDPEHRYQLHSLGLHSDFQIDGHRKLVDAIHAHGVKVQPQISHPGPESIAPFIRQLQPLGPSVIRTETTQQACREMTMDDIERVVGMYGDGALRAREAGYDGIELHAAHSYMMLGSFLSPLRNFRTDEYAGKKFEGRAKFMLDVLANIRSKVGEAFPITVRISGFERQPGGREIDDSQRLAPLLVDAGVDCFHVSGGVGDGNITQIITGPDYQPGYNLSSARSIRQVVDVPVMVVGQNMDPDFAERMVQEGEADIVAMGRAFLADPELPRKIRDDQTDEIIPCTLCQGCVDIMQSEFNGAGCVVNPRAGKEREYPVESAAEAKKVVVVGGGPGGLASAIYAAERGHSVTLFEREKQLGGRFRFASTVFPGNQKHLDWLLKTIERLGVEICLEEEVDRGALEALQPDAVILATGGRYEWPEFQGDDLPHVLTGLSVMNFLDQLCDQAANGTPLDLDVGEKVVVIGGNLIGVELSEHLGRLGKRVSLLETGRRFAMPAGKKRRGDHAARLDAARVSVNTGVEVKGILREGVVIAGATPDDRLIEADTVIVVGQPVADPALVERFDGAARQIHSVGDLGGFGLSLKSVRDAIEVAYSI